MNQNMEIWFTDKQTRLAAWRKWREHLLQLPYKQQLDNIAHWWKFVPMVNKSVDQWREETWPTPWELVGQGEFCVNGQGLGIFYTMVLAGLDCDLVLAQIKEETRLLVITADKKLLNYYDGDVINIDSANLQMLRIWHSSDLARLVKV